MLAVHQFQVPILPKKIPHKLPGVHPQFSEDSEYKVGRSARNDIDRSRVTVWWLEGIYEHARTCCDRAENEQGGHGLHG
jgi:hypothetical protein